MTGQWLLNVSINLLISPLTWFRCEELRQVGADVGQVGFVDFNEVHRGGEVPPATLTASNSVRLQISADFNGSGGVGVDDPS